MTLQEITQKYKKIRWLYMCTKYGLGKWEMINFTKSLVFPSLNLIKLGIPIDTSVCYKCNRELVLGYRTGDFFVKEQCVCSRDGTNVMTREKLKCVLTEDNVELVCNTVNRTKSLMLPNTLAYWKSKGIDSESAKTEISLVQKDRSSKSPATQKGSVGYSCRAVEFWMNQGFNDSEARDKIRVIQTTNGIEYYTGKYGEEVGTALFNNRIEQWLTSPGNLKMVAGRSKGSLSLFEGLGVGHYGPNEKTVRGKTKVHRVDYLYAKKVIEFFGDYWHANPIKYGPEAMIRKKKASDIWQHDEKKIIDLRDAGYDVLVIWERDYQINPSLILEKCRKFIT